MKQMEDGETVPLLQVDGMSKSFGGLWAVRDYKLTLPKNSIYGLIGPNGAGKSTIFNLLTGITKPDRGRVIFDELDITGLRPDRIARKGVVRTFQNLRLFKNLSAAMNVKIGMQTRSKYRVGDALLNLPGFLQGEEELDSSVDALLKSFSLDRYRDAKVDLLPYGIQKRVEIARAIAASPKLLLLDEPSTGMNTAESSDLAKLLLRIKNKLSLTMVIIEHRMPFVMGLSDRMQVLDHGVLIAEGSPEEVREDPAVIDCYLGGIRPDALS